MAIRNVWTITPNKKVISYRLQYTSSPDVQEDISNLHREIAYVFGGFPLDISLNSPKAVGSELSVAKQRLDDKAVFDVCKSLMKDKENDGSKEFASSASIIFDWVYIQAVLQKFNNNINLSDFTHFTDVKSQYGVIYSGARAVTILKLLQQYPNWNEIISDFEKFSTWHLNNVSDAQDAPRVMNDYRIVQSVDDHISIVSRLSKNILSIVAKKEGMQLWDSDGRYIMYAGRFNESWIQDFVS